MIPLKVHLESYPKYQGWIIIVFFGFSALGNWRNGSHGLSLLFFLFAAVGLYPILFLGPVEMNTEFIRVTAILGKWRMNWDEVETLEIFQKPRHQGRAMVLHGANKRLAIPGTMLWATKDEKQGIEFFDAQVKSRNIEIKPTRRAAFQMSKNTKVR